MALSRRDPNTIPIRPSQPPPSEIDNTLVAIEEITPGMAIELRNDGTTLKWGVHDSANEPMSAFVALDQIEHNLGVDDVYAAGDLVKAWRMKSGDRAWMMIPSGQNITQGALLQSNGDGKLKAYSTGPGGFVAASSPGAVNEDTRIWAEKL